MQKRLASFVLPALLTVFIGAPAFAQTRVGADVGSLHIRIAPDAPPPPRVEYRLERPGRDHRWIDGYWDRQDNRWAWAPGRWERPEHPSHRWVRPQYRRESGSYRYEPGHWSHQRLEQGDEYRRWHEEHRRHSHRDQRND